MKLFCAAVVLPFIWRVQLHRYHIQGVPRGDADATKQTQEGDHPRLAVAEYQEEAADTRYDARSRWGRRQKTELLKKFCSNTKCRYSNLIVSSYPASSNGQFCPSKVQTQCSRGAQLVYQGSWQSISCRRCWSHRWSPACSPLCCGGTCCWSACCWSTCTWTNLRRERSCVIFPTGLQPQRLGSKVKKSGS